MAAVADVAKHQEVARITQPLKEYSCPGGNEVDLDKARQISIAKKTESKKWTIVKGAVQRFGTLQREYIIDMAKLIERVHYEPLMDKFNKSDAPDAQHRETITNFFKKHSEFSEDWKLLEAQDINEIEGNILKNPVFQEAEVCRWRIILQIKRIGYVVKNLQNKATEFFKATKNSRGDESILKVNGQKLGTAAATKYLVESLIDKINSGAFGIVTAHSEQLLFKYTDVEKLKMNGRVESSDKAGEDEEAEDLNDGPGVKYIKDLIIQSIENVWMDYPTDLLREYYNGYGNKHAAPKRLILDDDDYKEHTLIPIRKKEKERSEALKNIMIGYEKGHSFINGTAVKGVGDHLFEARGFYAVTERYGMDWLWNRWLCTALENVTWKIFPVGWNNKGFVTEKKNIGYETLLPYEILLYRYMSYFEIHWASFLRVKAGIYRTGPTPLQPAAAIETQTAADPDLTIRHPGLALRLRMLGPLHHVQFDPEPIQTYWSRARATGVNIEKLIENNRSNPKFCFIKRERFAQPDVLHFGSQRPVYPSGDSDVVNAANKLIGKKSLSNWFKDQWDIWCRSFDDVKKLAYEYATAGVHTDTLKEFNEKYCMAPDMAPDMASTTAGTGYTTTFLPSRLDIPALPVPPVPPGAAAEKVPMPRIGSGRRINYKGMCSAAFRNSPGVNLSLDDVVGYINSTYDGELGRTAEVKIYHILEENFRTATARMYNINTLPKKRRRRKPTRPEMVHSPDPASAVSSRLKPKGRRKKLKKAPVPKKTPGPKDTFNTSIIEGIQNIPRTSVSLEADPCPYFTSPNINNPDPALFGNSISFTQKLSHCYALNTWYGIMAHYNKFVAINPSMLQKTNLCNMDIAFWDYCEKLFYLIRGHTLPSAAAHEEGKPMAEATPEAKEEECKPMAEGEGDAQKLQALVEHMRKLCN